LCLFTIANLFYVQVTVTYQTQDSVISVNTSSFPSAGSSPKLLTLPSLKGSVFSVVQSDSALRPVHEVEPYMKQKYTHLLLTIALTTLDRIVYTPKNISTIFNTN